MNDVNTLMAVVLPTLEGEDKKRIKDALVEHICKNVEGIRITNLLEECEIMDAIKPILLDEVTKKAERIIKQKGFLEKEIKAGIKNHINSEFEWQSDNGNLMINMDGVQEAVTKLLVSKFNV